MVDALKKDIADRLCEAIGDRGSAVWAVSGGATPAPLFDAMQHEELEWDKISVALVDERWVPLAHPRSNEAFIAGHLKRGKASSVHLIGMKTDHADALNGVEMVNARYAQLDQPFDSVLLGMGPDGHTASLFPGAQGLEDAFAADASTCVALTAKKSDITGNELERMSLSARAISDAHHVVVMITGDAKRTVLERAIKQGNLLPVGRLHALKPFEVYWAP